MLSEDIKEGITGIFQDAGKRNTPEITEWAEIKKIMDDLAEGLEIIQEQTQSKGFFFTEGAKSITVHMKSATEETLRISVKSNGDLSLHVSNNTSYVPDGPDRNYTASKEENKKAVLLFITGQAAIKFPPSDTDTPEHPLKNKALVRVEPFGARLPSRNAAALV